jgi:hypothetical protein
MRCREKASLGRPRSLARCVRELVGEDGDLIATYLLSVMTRFGTADARASSAVTRHEPAQT